MRAGEWRTALVGPVGYVETGDLVILVDGFARKLTQVGVDGVTIDGRGDGVVVRRRVPQPQRLRMEFARVYHLHGAAVGELSSIDPIP